jgi:hypothetical protein
LLSIDSIWSTIIVTIEKDTILKNNIHVKKVTERQVEAIGYTSNFMNIEGNQMKNHAYEISRPHHISIISKTDLPFTSPHSTLFSAHLKSKDQLSSLPKQFYFEPTEVINFKFPLQKGKNWIYRKSESGEDLIHIEKSVEDTKHITTPAGKFHCAEIKWNYISFPGGEDLSCIDYIAKEDVIKKSFYLGKFNVTDPNQELLYYGKSRVIYTLKEMKP